MHESDYIIIDANGDCYGPWRGHVMGKGAQKALDWAVKHELPLPFTIKILNPPVATLAERRRLQEVVARA